MEIMFCGKHYLQQIQVELLVIVEEYQQKNFEKSLGSWDLVLGILWSS